MKDKPVFLERIQSKIHGGLNQSDWQQFKREITSTTLTRLNTFFFVVLGLQAPLIVIDLLRRASGQWVVTPGYRYLFYLHVIFVPILIIMIVVNHFIRRTDVGQMSRSHIVLAAVFVQTMLLWGACVSGVDQLIHGQVSVYLLFAAGIAVSFCFTLEVVLIVYSLSYGLLLVLASLLQANKDVLEGHYINGTILIIVFVLMNRMAFRLRRRDYRNRRLIEKKNTDLVKAKSETEEKNRQVMEGIQYAKIIQGSILPDAESIRAFCPHYFTLWRPRELVGGDFYYFQGHADGYLFGIIDCTGHGVPAAFMTMSVKSVLDRITSDECHDDPSLILHSMEKILRSSFSKSSVDVLSGEGLDCGLCFVRPKSKSMLFSGARIPLLYTTGSTLNEMPAVRRSIVYSESRHDSSFQNQQIEIPDDGTFYMATDGYYHQTGGRRSLPLGWERFKSILGKCAELPLDEQEAALTLHFESYKNDAEQRDDIAILGFRVK